MEEATVFDDSKSRRAKQVTRTFVRVASMVPEFTIVL